MVNPQEDPTPSVPSHLSAEQQELLGASVHILGLSFRTCAALENDDSEPNRVGVIRHIRTVGQLLQCTKEDILNIPNLGEKTLNDIYDALARIGFRRPGEVYLPSEKTRREEQQLKRKQELERRLGFRESAARYMPKEEE